MYIIGEVTVEPEVTRELFSCDLTACHGACCTLPGCRGAPLADHELPLLVRGYEAARKYLPARHIEVAETDGVYEGRPGDYATTSVEGRECVFVYYEGAIAKCALERAFLNGETSWRKPVSCHLFPIRVSGGRQPRLRYERISECRPARVQGKERGVTVAEFLADPLQRLLGREWYARLIDTMKNENVNG